jgi:hypothetical protein
MRAWTLILTFAFGYFLGWQRGVWLGNMNMWEKLKIVFPEAEKLLDKLVQNGEEK